MLCTLLSVQWLFAQNSSGRGNVINHKPKSSGISLGSPSIVVLPNGDYLVSHSIEKRDEGDGHRTAVFKSIDKGLTWYFVTRMGNQRWANVFFHEAALYKLGADRAFGNMAIRKALN